MNPRETAPDVLRSALLRVLESAAASGGLTSGQLRSALIAKMKVPASLAGVRGACHELWQRGLVVIEPPGAGRREYRVWHANLRRAVAEPGKSGEPERRTPPPGRASREGERSGEENFRVTFCGQLAGEWARTACGETREVLRRLLVNFGAERVERAGEVVSFKGRRHQCEAPVLPGAGVRVVEAGWVLRQGMGEYLLTKARVVPA